MNGELTSFKERGLREVAAGFVWFSLVAVSWSSYFFTSSRRIWFSSSSSEILRCAISRASALGGARSSAICSSCISRTRSIRSVQLPVYFERISTMKINRHKRLCVFPFLAVWKLSTPLIDDFRILNTTVAARLETTDLLYAKVDRFLFEMQV